jgi:peptide/nickel transport system substrate-binding protein
MVGACTSNPQVETTTTAPPETTTTAKPIVTTSSSPDGLPQHPTGGVAIIATDSEPQTLNSFMAGGDLLSVSLIGQSYTAGVYEVDGETLMLIPELVTELPTTANGGVIVNTDGTMTVRYTILDGAQWEDGVPISGDDFQFTLETIMSPDLPIDKTYYEDIVSSKPGAKTFEFTMAQPTLRYETMFGEIIPKHSVEGTDFVVDWNDKRWVSAGPFIFEDWTKGESITLRRNPNYWKSDPETEQQLPYLDSVMLLFMSDTPEMIDAFKARDIDVFSPKPTVENVQVLQVLEPKGAVIEALPGPVWEHLNFQFGPGRFDRNETSCNEIFEMRLAVAQAIDREAVTDDILGGMIEPLQSYVDTFSPALSQQAWSQFSFDPEAAAGNHASAIEASGRECSVVFTANSENDGRVRLSELLVGMFAESGIEYQSQLEGSLLFFGDTLSKGSWDLGQWTWQGFPGFASLVRFHDWFDPDSPPPDGKNFYRWGTEDSDVVDDSTQRYAELRDAMQDTIDFDELSTLIQEAEKILADNLVIVPLYSHPLVAAVWADEIVGFKHNPTRAGFTWNIETWRRSDL